VRRSRLLASIDNSHSFHFDRPSLVRLLVDSGFTTVVECCAPLEPGKPDNRITLAARRGQPVIVSTYPWVNSMSEDDIERFLGRDEASRGTTRRPPSGLKGFVKRMVGSLGFEIRRIPKSVGLNDGQS
jgi:hypothetical protein